MFFFQKLKVKCRRSKTLNSWTNTMNWMWRGESGTSKRQISTKMHMVNSSDWSLLLYENLVPWEVTVSHLAVQSALSTNMSSGLSVLHPSSIQTVFHSYYTCPDYIELPRIQCFLQFLQKKMSASFDLVERIKPPRIRLALGQWRGQHCSLAGKVFCLAPHLSDRSQTSIISII